MAESVDKAEQVRRWLAVFQNRNAVEKGVVVNRAVKEALEGVPEMARALDDEVNDLLVATANFANRGGDGIPVENIVARFGDKYRAGGAGSLDGVLTRLKNVAKGDAIPDEVVARTVRSLAEADAPALSPDAAEGALHFMSRAGDDIPLLEREATLRHMLVGTKEESEALMNFIRTSPGDETAQSLARMYRRIPCPVP